MAAAAGDGGSGGVRWWPPRRRQRVEGGLRAVRACGLPRGLDLRCVTPAVEGRAEGENWLVEAGEGLMKNK